MTLSIARVRHYLKQFKFEKLFVEELGWDRLSEKVDIVVQEETYSLRCVANKRGVRIFKCDPGVEGKVPDYSTRQKIEKKLAKYAYEHLIIFIDAEETIQIWQWVSRQPGLRAAYREHAFHPKSQPGDSLIQKLEAISFELSEEEGLTLAGVVFELKDAFDRDRITKKFYDRFKKEQQAFLKFITGITDLGARTWYASLMLNRLMFVYFIQKKGFLDGDPDYLQNRLKAVQERKGKDKFLTFYRYFLVQLFHEGFSKQPKYRHLDAELKALLGNVPYLDGGLFELHEIEENHPDINIPDKAFDALFAFFDQYDWHLDNRPLRNDREINPDVLGYIFEKYINQKEMGAYYTKEDITEYIGKNTIIPFLFNAAQKRCAVAFEPGSALWRLLRDDPDRYIYPAVRKGVLDEYGEIIPLPEFIRKGVADVSQRDDWNKPADTAFALPTETWREHVARRSRCLEIREKLSEGNVTEINDLITYNLDIRQFAEDAIATCEGPDLLRAFYRSIAGHIPEPSHGKYEAGMSILDPTCGSGAFLFAALTILEPLYKACLQRMEAFLDDLAQSGEPHSPKKYEDFRNILADIGRHSSPDYFIYKSIIVNNLFGVDIMPEAVEICKLRLFLKLVAQVDKAKDLEPLPDIDFNIRAGNTLVGFVTREQVRQASEWKMEGKQEQGKLLLGDAKELIEEIEEKAEIVERAYRAFRQMQTEYGMDAKVFSGHKTMLRDKLRELTRELDQYLAKGYEIDPENRGMFNSWLNSHMPFHWFVEFFGIMSQGGFSVIIGNPPYVDYNKVKKRYSIHNYTTEPSRNLYAFTLERSLKLILNSGYFGVIVPISLVSIGVNGSLRRLILNNFNASYHANFAIRPAKLFDGVEQRLTILIGATNRSKYRNLLWSSKYYQWFASERLFLFKRIEYTKIKSEPIPEIIVKPCGALGISIINKIKNNHTPNVSNYLTRNSPYRLIFHRTPGYWIRSMDFLPYFNSPQGDRSIFHIRELHIKDPEYLGFIGSIMSSTLFFYWFFSTGNCRNLTLDDVKHFPVGNPDPNLLKHVNGLFFDLMKSYKSNSVIKHRGESEYQEFNWFKSKTIVDKIDVSISNHYGLTLQETDFIINYDIKYRSVC